MALSMLTACGSSDTDTTVAAAVAETATSNLTVVAYAVDEVEAYNTQNSTNLNTAFTGNETADLATAVDRLEDGAGTAYDAYAVITVNDLSALTYAKTDTSYVVLIEKTSTLSDQVVGYALGTSITNSNNTIQTVSVFDAELDLTTTLAGSVSSTTVSNANTDKYWVIVVTTK